MAVELSDLIPSLKREVSPPGVELYPDSSDEEWLGRLTDAFWEARLNGLLRGYEESNGIVTPLSGSTDLSRDLQQLIVLYAGFRLALTAFQNINSVFRSKAGPVEFEVQKSATTLRGVLDALRERIKLVLDNNGSYAGSATSVAQFDQVLERSCRAAGIWEYDAAGGY